MSSSWAKALMQPHVWEELADIPKGPSYLASCFRRASSYIYREVDSPVPYVDSIKLRSTWMLTDFVKRNVNRRGVPPTIRGCLLTDRSTIKDYIDELKNMYYEQIRLRENPAVLQLPDAILDEIKSKSGGSHRQHCAFASMKLITCRQTFGVGASHVIVYS